MQDIFLVSFGAVLGANTRFIIYKKLENINLRKDSLILVINTFASFCLGFFLAVMTRLGPMNFSYQLILFFSIGFLGSLSTFSTFVYDLYDLFMKLKFSRAITLFIFSWALGLLSLVIGFLLGNQ